MIETILTSELIEKYTKEGRWQGVAHLAVFERNVTFLPDKIAIKDKRSSVTYQELNNKANRLAVALGKLGVTKEDRVAIQLPNWVELGYVYFAACKLGAITVPIVSYYRKKEVKYILEHSEAKIFFVPENFAGFDYASFAQELLNEVPTLQHVIVVRGTAPKEGILLLENLLNTAGEVAPYLVKPDPNDLVLLQYTSGTETQPKGVLWTYNVQACGAFIGQSNGLGTTDIILAVAPVCHAFAFQVGLFMSTWFGATLVMQESFQPEETLELAAKEKATVIAAVPPQIISIVNVVEAKGMEDKLQTVRYFQSAGAACPEAIIRKLQTKFYCGFCTIYGMTENSCISVTNLNDPPELIATTAGHPHPSLEIKAVDDEGNDLPPGEIGELVYRGGTVFAGYFKDLPGTRKLFRGEWFLTGDLGYVGEDGYVRVAGRKKDTINRGGEKFSPQEVEELLYAHPKVLQVAVVAMPDPRLGERSCAYVVPQEGAFLTLEEITTFLNAKEIARFKLPERLELVKELPMTSSGKIRKVVLREMIAQEIQQEFR